MGCSGGVAKHRHETGGQNTETGDGSDRPGRILGLNSAAVAQLCNHTRKRGGELCIVGGVSHDANLRVEIRDGVRDAGDLADKVAVDGVGGADVDSTGTERAQRGLTQAAEVDGFVHDVEAVDDHLRFGDNLFGDGGGGIDVEHNGRVGGVELDVEVRRGELRVFHACQQRAGLQMLGVGTGSRVSGVGGAHGREPRLHRD